MEWCWGALPDDHHTSGQIGLRVIPWRNAQFDDLSITKTAPWPRFLPHAQMRVAATSEHTANARGYTYQAANAIDDRPDTAWSAEWAPPAPLPQSITLELDRVQTTHGLTCQPRLDGSKDGYVSDYRIYLSANGKDFSQVAAGTWPVSSSTKIATWPAQKARFVRLEATQKSSGVPVVGELNIALTSLNGNYGK
jgi:hypothetical protein